MQSLDPGRIDEPLAYYSRTSPIGEVFAASAGNNKIRRIGIVGLGSGCLAAYGRHGQKFTFYEIDPTVERIARNARFFTFLRDSAANVEIVLGDARLSLKTAPDRSYDLIVLDAFNSDSIPLHLLTREAIRLYLAKLAQGGVLAFNISNRYLELRPVIADLASDAGLFSMIGDDSNVSAADQANGKKPSLWALMARQQSDVPVLNKMSRWTAVSGTPGGKVWTDDFSNMLRVIKWSN
jgi:SAM-dependent methyltransferase